MFFALALGQTAGINEQTKRRAMVALPSGNIATSSDASLPTTFEADAPNL